MKATALYRIASVLLVLFAVGHTFGFRRTKPEWGVEQLIRTYWDFYVGFGLFVSVLLVFAAVVAWQLGSLSAETLLLMRVIEWALAVCFVMVTILSWRYFFIVPIVFSIVITACLIAAAWLSGKPGPS